MTPEPGSVRQPEERGPEPAPHLLDSCITLEEHLGGNRWRGRAFFGHGRKGDVQLTILHVAEDAPRPTATASPERAASAEA